MRKETNRWPDVRAIRSELGISQSELASFLGLSPRTVQSCEQGWRTLSPAVERQLLILLLMFRRGATLNEMTCWEEMDCPPQTREHCLVYAARQGYICWFITGNLCGCLPLHNWEKKKEACRSCRFFTQLFKGDIK